MHLSRKKRIILVGTSFLLLAVLNLWLFWFLLKKQQHHLQSDLDFKASIVTEELEQVLTHCYDAFRFLEGWYNTSRNSDPRHFSTVLRPFQENYPFLQAMEWIPRVSGPERAYYEQRLRDRGFKDFQFRELDRNGTLQPAGQRSEYFPVYFVEPYLGNEAALGLDLASDRSRKNALVQSIKSRKIVASSPIRLVQETANQKGFLLYYPLFQNGSGRNDSSSEPEECKGFFLAVFRVGKLLKNVLETVPHSQLNIWLYDVTDSKQPQLLASHSFYSLPHAVPEEPDPGFFKGKLHVKQQFEMGMRQWALYYTPKPEFFAINSNVFVWLVPASGLLFGSLLLLYAWLLQEKNIKISIHAVSLEQTKERLEKEIEVRFQAESALEDTRKELQQIFNSAPFFISMVDKEMRVLRLNPSMEKLVGMESEAVRGKYCYDIWGQYAADVSRKGLTRVCDSCKAQQSLVDGKTHTFIRQLPGEKFIEVLSSPVRDEHGSIVGAMEIGSDVSKREKALQALQASELNYRTLFESSPGVIAVADFSDIKKYLNTLAEKSAVNYELFFKEHLDKATACLERIKILEVNKSGLQLFGATSNREFINKLFHIVDPNKPTFAIQGIAAIGDNRTSFEHEIILHHLSGNEIYGIIRWKVKPGYEQTYKRVFLTFTDITARKNAEEQLAAKRKQLQQLSLRLVGLEEENRKHIARELHDKLGQQLTALGINLSILEQSGLLESDIAQSRRVADALSQLEEMTELVRDITADLRPPVLDDYGLEATLRWYSEKFKQRTGISIYLSGEEIPRLQSDLELALFRIVQEALTNVVKHAKAEKAIISWCVIRQTFSLVIEDDGKGLPSPKDGNNSITGLGILSMQERIQAFAGQLRIESRPGEGLRVVAEVKI